MNFISMAKAEENYTFKNRRYLHENPELTWHEFNTLSFIKKELEQMQIAYTEIKYGGIIGKIQGKKSAENKKTLMLRADMDALPVEECEEHLCGKRKYISKVPGVSHMCGHDGHTAMLLTSAKILKENEENLDGDIILMFERGEEGGENCYFLLKYLQDNEIKIDGCWSMHINPNIEKGKMGILNNGVMAGLCAYDVTLKGKGGHGSRPDLANNPVDCFVAIQNALQSVVTRKISPFETLTFSTCLLEASQKINVISDELRFGGSARFYEMETAGEPFKEVFFRICDNIAAAYECSVQYNLFLGPLNALKNNRDCAEFARKILGNVLGEENIVTCEPLMGSESMAEVHLYYPGVYCLLGTRDLENGCGADMHHPKFELNEEILTIGVASTLVYAFEFLERKPEINFTPYQGDLRALYSDEVERIKTEVDY